MSLQRVDPAIEQSNFVVQQFHRRFDCQQRSRDLSRLPKLGKCLRGIAEPMLDLGKPAMGHCQIMQNLRVVPVFGSGTSRNREAGLILCPGRGQIAARLQHESETSMADAALVLPCKILRRDTGETIHEIALCLVCLERSCDVSCRKKNVTDPPMRKAKVSLYAGIVRIGRRKSTC